MSIDRLPRRVPQLLLLVILGSVVLACGAGGAVLSNVGNSVGERPAPEAPAGGEGIGDGDARTGGSDEQAPMAIRDGTRVVHTGSLQLVVEDVDAAIVTASGLVRVAGGSVAASERTSDGDNPVATITYRIPAGRWDSVLQQLRDLGRKVAGERTSAVEVTGQIVDLEARIRNLRATEAALQAILSRAERIADVLEVQRELTTVRGEIERLDAQRVSLEDQAAYGTLAVTYGAELVAVVEAAKEWDPASEFDRAVASLVSVLQGLATVGIWFAIVWLPILLVVAVAIGLVVLIVRRVNALRASASTAPTTG